MNNPIIDHLNKLITRYQNANETLQGFINAGYKNSEQKVKYKNQIEYNKSIINRTKKIIANETAYERRNT